MTNDNENTISALFDTESLRLYDAAYRYFEMRTVVAAELDDDPECFSPGKLWLYDASRRYYEILAVACAQMATTYKAEPFFAAAFEDASDGARAYADHCRAVADMAKRGESEQDIAAFDFKYGSDARRHAEVNIAEARGCIADDQRRAGLFNCLRNSAAAAQIIRDQTFAPAANDRHSPLDGGAPVPAGAFEKTPA